MMITLTIKNVLYLHARLLGQTTNFQVTHFDGKLRGCWLILILMEQGHLSLYRPGLIPAWVLQKWILSYNLVGKLEQKVKFHTGD